VPLLWAIALSTLLAAEVNRETVDALNRALLRDDPRPRIEALARLHSLRATSTFDEAAALVAGWAREAGLTVEIEDFPSDGTIRYGPFLSEPGWRVLRAELDLVEPEALRIGDGVSTPLALAWFSGSAEMTADLVDVDEGLEDSHYAGKDVRGRIVLASGPHRAVHEQAVYQRGAAGVVSSWHLFGDRYPDVLSSDGYGIRPWVSDAGDPPGFVFSISSRQATKLRRYLQSRARVRLSARVATETYPSHYRVVSAVLRGVAQPEEEVLVVNHLDSTSPGAVHNAAAALALVEAGAALSTLDRPQRTVRFLWVPEHVGTMAYLLAHPELEERVVAAVNVDMPTARHSATGAVTYLYRTPDSSPSFADDLFGEILEWVSDGNTPALGTDLFPYPVVSDHGTREAFHARTAPFEGLSDHVEFVSAGIPMGFFGAWPFELLGTTRDTLDVFDATQMKRMSLVLAAGAYRIASASEVDVLAIARGFVRRAEKRLLDVTSDALRYKLDRELRALDTLSRLHGLDLSTFRDRLLDAGRRAGVSHPPQEETSAVFARTDVLRGPLTEDFVRERLGRAPGAEEGALFQAHPYAAFEVWNFIDGERSASWIRGAIEAELGAVGAGLVRRIDRNAAH
jgi:aminopeptidase YwaD